MSGKIESGIARLVGRNTGLEANSTGFERGCGKREGGALKTGRRWYAGRFSLLVTMLFAAVVFSGCATTGGSSAKLDTFKGVVAQPVKGAYLFVYQKGADPHGPPFTMSEATTAEGAFDIELPDGEYTVVARRHANGLPGSPLSEGDLKSDPIDIKVVNGKVESQEFYLHTKDDTEQHFGAGEKSKTAISGLVLNSDGNPMKGFRVHVYTYAQMSERPKYVSAATGPDGKYIVYLPKGGTYYIAARDHFGGPPKIGDYYGRYDEGTIDPSGVIVKTGNELDNINITVHKVW